MFIQLFMGTYDTPTKKTPQILTSSSRYPVICLFHKDKKIIR